MVSSKYGRAQVWATIIFSFVFTGIACANVFLSNPFTAGKALLFYLALFVAVYLWHQLLNKATRIYFDDQGIKSKKLFKSTKHSWQ